MAPSSRSTLGGKKTTSCNRKRQMEVFFTHPKRRHRVVQFVGISTTSAPKTPWTTPRSACGDDRSNNVLCLAHRQRPCSDGEMQRPPPKRASSPPCACCRSAAQGSYTAVPTATCSLPFAPLTEGTAPGFEKKLLHPRPECCPELVKATLLTRAIRWTAYSVAPMALRPSAAQAASISPEGAPPTPIPPTST